MNYSTDNQEQLTKISDVTMSEGTKERSARIDRTSAKYSESDFLAMPRSQQYALAEKYWNGKSADFDDGTFQFSYTHFAEVCQRIGFRKGIVDDGMPGEDKNASSDDVKKIYIDRGKRPDPIEKKITLNKITNDKLESLTATFTNMEKSKFLEAVIEMALDELLEKREEGKLSVAYRPMEEEKLL